MKITKYNQLPENKETCCTKTAVKQLITAEGFDIKIFEMQPDGYSPLHSHPEQHQVFILGGEGTVSDGKKALRVQNGDAISIRSNEPHQFRTAGDKPLIFLAVTFSGKK
jgi:quercetin dioxygenase-like cupin family protein